LEAAARVVVVTAARDRKTVTVKWFDADRGYGFIACDAAARTFLSMGA
jgi:putative methionine-R-sulfoxide reductase with GAF domain